MLEKNNFRKEIIKLRNSMTQKVVIEKSNQIINTLNRLDFFKRAETIYTYVSKGNEVDTLSLIEMCFKQGKKVAVPKIYANNQMKYHYIQSLDDLKIGKFDVLEPETTAPIAEISNVDKVLMIIPAVVLDKEMHRIGYGGGFFDRYLNKINDCKKIALVYEFQLKEHIPYEIHDVLMDCIITENNIYYS